MIPDAPHVPESQKAPCQAFALCSPTPNAQECPTLDAYGVQPSANHTHHPRHPLHPHHPHSSSYPSLSSRLAIKSYMAWHDVTWYRSCPSRVLTILLESPLAMPQRPSASATSSSSCNITQRPFVMTKEGRGKTSRPMLGFRNILVVQRTVHDTFRSQRHNRNLKPSRCTSRAPIK